MYIYIHTYIISLSLSLSLYGSLEKTADAPKLLDSAPLNNVTIER